MIARQRRRRPRDVHGPQAVVRGRRRADLPGPLAEDRAARGRRPRRRAAGEALLPARAGRQARPGRRAALGDRGRPRDARSRRDRGGRLRGRRPERGGIDPEVADAEEDETARKPGGRSCRGRGVGRGRGRGRSRRGGGERRRRGIRSESPRTKPPRSPRPRGRGLRAEASQLIPKPTTGRGAFVELVVIVALAIGLALADPGLRRQAVPDPLGVDGADARLGQRVLVNRVIYHFSDPEIGDIVVFHPPEGADSGDAVRRARRSPDEAVPAPGRRRSPTPTSSSGSSPGPGDTADDPGRPPGRQRRRGQGGLHQAMRRREQLRPPARRSRSPRHITS